MSRPEWIEVGRVSRPHGVRGEARITCESDNPERFTPGSVLYARSGRKGVAGLRKGERVRLTVETVRGREDFPIVAFREVADREAAELLRGFVLEVHSSQLPELTDDEYYQFDLVGLEARDTGGVTIGRVTDVIESAAHPIMVVSLESHSEVLVPFVVAAVPKVAVQEGFLVVESRFLGEAIALAHGDHYDPTSQ